MKRPTEVWICGMRFTITDDPALAENEEMRGGDRDAIPRGHCAMYRQSIFIARDLDEDFQKETLYHEMLHAHDLCFNVGLTLEAWKVLDNQKRRRFVMEEHTVEVLARALFITMRDPRNAPVFAWLMEGSTA